MKKIIKLLSICLALILILSSGLCTGITALADDENYCGENTTWNYVDGILTISGTGVTNDYKLFYQANIPWYSYMSQIKSVVVEEGVTGLGNTLFVDCINLTSVTLADSVKSIGVNTFSGCESLEEFTVTKGIEFIDSFAFTNCTSMVNYKVDEENEFFICEDGSLLSKDKTKFYNYPIGRSDEEYTIPDTVTVIMPYAFSKAVNLKTVNFPEGLLKIDDEAFYGCTSLESVKLYEGLKILNGGVFQECSSLSSIDLPDGITHIGGLVLGGTAFSNDFSNWENNVLYCKNYLLSGTYMYMDEEKDIFEFSDFEGDLTVKDGTVLIAQEAFSFCDVTSVSFPDSLKYLCYGAFYGTQISGAELTGACVLEDQVFYDCEKFNLLKLNSGIISIGFDIAGETPYWTNVENYTDGLLYNNGYVLDYNSSLGATPALNDDTVLIATNAFESSKISDINIPGSLKYIGNEAFINCSYLSSVTIPESVEKIGEYAYGYSKTYNSGKEEYVYTVKSNVTIKGYNNTVASEYAAENGITFEAFDAECNHNFEWVIDSQAGCDRTGLKHEECSICHETQNENTVISATGEHSWEWVIDEEATCGNTGFKHKECTICHKKQKENTVIPATGEHSYDVKTYAPTCETGGYTHHKCRGCPYEYKDNYVDPKGHKYDYDCDAWCNVCYLHREVTHTYAIKNQPATLTRNGKIDTYCTVCGAVDYSEPIYYPKTIRLSQTSYTYNGKVKTPAVTVRKSNGIYLKKGVDYIVTYQSGRKNVGKYKVTIKFKGKYSGTKVLYFKINPAKTSVSKLTAGKKSLKVNIAKKASQITGYQIQYSTSKKFSSSKTQTIKSYKTTNATLNGLKSKKTYYVRVRTYKTVNGVKYYSDWSSAKYKKTK